MAFNTSDDIDIVIRVSADGAIRVLKQTGQEIDSIGEKARKVEPQVSRLENSIVSIGKAAVAAAVSIKGIQAAISLIEKGAAVADVTESFQKLSTQAGALSSSVLPRLRDAVAGTISDFDLMRKSNELLRAGLTPDQFIVAAQAARILADQVGGSTAAAFDQLSQDMIRGTDRQFKLLGITIENVKAQSELERVLKTRQIQEAALVETVARHGEVSLDSADGIDRLRVALQNKANASAAALANNELLTASLNGLANVITSVDLSFQGLIGQIPIFGTVVIQAAGAVNYLAEQLGLIEQVSKGSGLGAQIGTSVGQAGEAAKRAAQGIKSLSSAERDAQSQAKKLDEAHKNLNKTLRSITKTDGIPELDKALKKIIEDFKSGTINAKQFSDAVNSIGKGASAEGLETLSQRTKVVFDEVEQEIADVEEAHKEMAQAAADAQKEAADEAAKEWDAFADDIESSVASAIGDSISAAFNGGDFKQIGKDLATDLGRDIGEYFGGEIGGEIGAALGEAVFDAFESAFGGGKDPGAKARKSIDAWFAEIFNANRLTVIVNGELQKIKDLVFSAGGDSEEFEDGSFDDALAALPAAAMEAFNGVGAAYEAMLEEMGINTEEISGQIAAIFVNNIGGSISDLRLLIEATGHSAESLADALFNAFLEGEMSALELAEAMRGLNRTLQKGIPEAIGAIDVAWQRMIDAGFEGGRALLDAIQSVGVEAQELGINTLPQLADYLVSTFGFASSQVQAFMAAMAAAGITSLADLADASQDTLASIAAGYQVALSGGDPAAVQIHRPTYTPSPIGGSGSSGGFDRSSTSKTESAEERRKKQKAKQKRDRFEGFRDLVLGTEEYARALESLSAGTISAIQVDQIYNDLHAEAIAISNALREAEQKAAREIRKKGEVSAETAREIAGLREAMDSLGSITEETSTATGDFININEELFDFLGKFGDDLNAIGIAADLAGVSFRDLQKAAVDAFKAGDLTATEALKRLGGGADGSPESITDAFKRVKQGAAGGILSIDALRDLAKNVIEGGGDSFEDIIKPLLDGGVAIKDVQDLFIALGQTGIDSIDELSKVTDEKAIEIFASLEGIGFNFDQVTDATIRLRDELNQIPTSKKVDIEINAIIDPETRRILKQLGLLEKITTKNYGKASFGLKSPEVGPS